MNKLILFFILTNFAELIIFSKYREMPFKDRLLKKKDDTKKANQIKKIEIIEHFLKVPKNTHKNNFEIQKEEKLVRKILEKNDFFKIAKKRVELLRKRDFNSNFLSHKTKYKKIKNKENSKGYNKIN